MDIAAVNKMIEYHNFTVCIVNYYTSNIIPNVLNSLRDFQDKNNMRIDVHIFNNSKDDNLDDVLKTFRLYVSRFIFLRKILVILVQSVNCINTYRSINIPSLLILTVFLQLSTRVFH